MAQISGQAIKRGGLRQVVWRGKTEWMCKDEAEKLEAQIWN